MKQKNAKKNVALERELMGPNEDMTNVSKKKKNSRWVWLERSIYASGTLLACMVLAAAGISYDKAHGVGRYSYNYINKTPVGETASSTTDPIKLERHEEAVDAMAPIADNNSESKDSEIETETQDGSIIWYAPDWYDSTRLSYMDFRTITAPETLQYQLQYDGYTVTDWVTGIRKRGDRYMIALGQEFGLTGTEVDVHLENGVEIPCIIGDSKEYFDTINNEGRIGNDGGIVEFIVDTDYLPEEVVWLGSNEAQFNHDWQSPVEYIEIY